ncbi:hypothetical protein SAMN04488128_102479 [Chitinophaga eiseniae]|uniref:MarR family transcriptional regulator n=1 Tax=Chitinophaga eiseniae TaxID=634771 RepID=A0A1T4QNG5_9BACT|nr:hypothetical protein [Chitinophaga eiseniae]SKA05235.1 hypothetical protein SAMN04488128_102479 [Chitinophaga eiseniae]
MELERYIKDILGNHFTLADVPKEALALLPLYIKEEYHISQGEFWGYPVILMALKQDLDFHTQRTEKHLQTIADIFQRKVVLVMEEMQSYTRRRLIEKKINFIVPGKQLFLPELLIDLRERFSRNYGNKTDTLIPSAQQLFLYYMLHRHSKIQLTDLTLKEIAKKFNYTPTAISMAAENLKKFDLCDIKGSKEKNIVFKEDRPALWHMAQKHLVTPVLKEVFIDKIPDKRVLASNVSALPEYSDMNPGAQQYYAIEKKHYYHLRAAGALVNENPDEGQICLEVWKYDPYVLTYGITEDSNVDPLSLFLSLKDNEDERIEMALDQIIEKFIW